MRINLAHRHCISDHATDISDLPKKLRLPFRLHPDADISQSRHCSGMSWINATIAQRVDDELLILVLDKDAANYDQLYLGGQLLIVDNDIDAATVIDAVQQLPEQAERKQTLATSLWAYLQGETCYEDFAPVFNAYLTTETVVGIDEYRCYSVGQFLWRIDKPRRERLLLLLANHSYRAYKIIVEQMVNAHMDRQVSQGKIDLATRLGLDSDDYREIAYKELMDWLFAHEVKRELLVLFAIKHYHNGMGEYLAQLARSGELKPLLSYLHISNRAALVDILAQQTDAAELLTIFKGEKSRQVRDSLAAATPAAPA